MAGNEAVKRKIGGHCNRVVNSAVWKYCNGKPERIIEALSNGATLESIGKKAGVSKQAVYQWLVRQDSKFAEKVADAIAGETLDIIDNEDIDPRARAIRCNQRNWLLERRFPKQYGRRDQLEVSGEIDIVGRLQRARNRLSEPVIEADSGDVGVSGGE